MREEYEKELEELKQTMVKAEAFAEKLPFFEEEIISRKLTGEEKWLKIASRYKDTYFPWSINRGFYSKSLGAEMTNHPTHDYQGYYFNIYINTLSMYDRHENYGIYEAVEKVGIYYTDHLNATFYVEDEKILEFLEVINDWYLSARDAARKQTAQEKLEKAEKDLANLKKQAQT